MSSDDFLNDKWFKKLDNQTQHIINRIGVNRKTFDEVFDLSTLHRLGTLISHGIIDQVDFPISTGKEANIFRALTPQKKHVALKIYRTSNLTFKHITKYIEGDPRFRLTTHSRRNIIQEWTKKEYKNLQRLKHNHIRVPHPLHRIGNILVMQYIGTKDTAAPLLKNSNPKNPDQICKEILSFIKTMYQKADLVHGDLSPYNILLYRQKPYIIDVGQAVLLEHPLAQDLLKRDINNITTFFNTWDIPLNPSKILKDITTSQETP
jgi:RIO kinase 1